MMKPSFDESAVSETLGYILIFGIVVAGIAMVFLIGSQILADTQESANFQGMQQGFEVISSDLRRTAFDESPIMTTRVKIDYGTLAMMSSARSDYRIVIRDSNNNELYDMPIGILEFDSSHYGKSISLENGALVTTYENGSYGSIMAKEPRIFYSASNHTLLVSTINLEGDDISYSGGIDNIRSGFLNSNMQTNTAIQPPIWLCIRTNNTGAWDTFFTGTGTMPAAAKVLEIPSGSQWTNVSISDLMAPGTQLNLAVVTYNVSIEL